MLKSPSVLFTLVDCTDLMPTLCFLYKHRHYSNCIQSAVQTQSCFNVVSLSVHPCWCTEWVSDRRGDYSIVVYAEILSFPCLINPILWNCYIACFVLLANVSLSDKMCYQKSSNPRNVYLISDRCQIQFSAASPQRHLSNCKGMR